MPTCVPHVRIYHPHALPSGHHPQVIHPVVQRALLARGILPLQRLSVVHLGAVAHVTGAQPISTTTSLHLLPGHAMQQALGCVGPVHVTTVGT